MLKVTLLQHTKEPEKLIATAAKLCYSPDGIDDIVSGLDCDTSSRFLEMLLGLGHESPLEHVAFTFGIEGVSRSLLAQLTRHRIASFSVKSQRYVVENQFDYIIPPEIDADEDARRIFIQAMESDQKDYDQIRAILEKKHISRLLKDGKNEKTAKSQAEKMAAEDARYLLPNACETKLIATFNTRSLHNFFRLRLCERAQWEIRKMAEQMYLLVRDVSPTLFKTAGPPCAFGPCAEGKMTCGLIAEKRKQYRGDL